MSRLSFTATSLSVSSALSVAVVSLCGCTIGGVAKPTLANTTSAEQTQRIFWDDVKAQKWQAVQGLLVPNVTWRNGSELLTRDDIVPYLRQLHIRDVLVTNVVVKANANEMTLVYDLQYTPGDGASQSTQAQPATLHAVAVWQQLPPPPPDATKKEKKQAQNAAPYLLTVEDLVPAHP